MKTTTKTAAPKNVDEYIKAFPPSVHGNLNKLRQTIKAAAPQAEEIISYRMPAYKYHGRLVYFAAYKNHIGFYPMSGTISAFKKELSDYKGAKGSVQFPHDKPIPFGLVSKMIKFRANQNEEKLAAKKSIKPITPKTKSKK